MPELVYLVGASGAGKDSLLGYARERLPADAPVVFAHRYITRPAAAGGENHVALSEAEFSRRQRAGCFALNWNSHGLRYGIGIEIDLWLARGLSVVMNGSRDYLDQAAMHYPALRPVLVRVPLDLLAQRLRARGRESQSAIAKRLERARALDALQHPRLSVIDNDVALEQAGERFLNLLVPQRPMSCA